MLISAPFHAIDVLKDAIQGSVFVPGDAGYDEARQAWNRSFQHQPAVIVLAKNAADVAAAVRYAREADMPIGVQSTGHGVARTADDGLLIITSLMNDVQVNAATQTAWVEAGVLWGAVLEKAQAVGLAPLLGSSPGVGAIGYTLGGGIGWLARKYGLSADNVNRFEIVTADGEIRTASATENSDLFWALRGGGGSFGIVTGMEIKLYPVTTTYGGNLLYPIEMAREVLQRYREWIANAPDELTSSVVLMNYPPIPAIPDFLRGKSFVQIRGNYTGRVEDGEGLLKFWLDWQAPIANLWRPMPFTEAATISNDPVDPLPGYGTGAWLREISDEAIDTLIQYGTPQNGPAAVVFIEVRHVGGAISRVDAQSSAYSNRDAELLMYTVGVTPTPEARAFVQQHVANLKRDLAPVETGGVYMNFLEGEEKHNRTKDAYTPEKFERLQAIKAKYDPENRFSLSFGINPAK